MRNKLLTNKYTLVVTILFFASFGCAGYLRLSRGSVSQPTAGNTVYSNSTPHVIVVSAPTPGARVGKRFTVSGIARGNWYFEASFPIVLMGSRGEILVRQPVQAKGEWMTEKFVPFETVIIAPETYRGPALLVLKKDNPSGIPQYDASVSFPVLIQ